MARTNGKAAKDVLFLMRPLGVNLDLLLRPDSAASWATVSALGADTAQDVADSLWRGFERGGLCWQGRFGTEFNPSSANYLRYYLWLSGWSGGEVLWADSAVQALYFQMGEKGGENRWRLYRQRGKETDLWWSGPTVYKKTAGEMWELRLRIDVDSVSAVDSVGACAATDSVSSALTSVRLLRASVWVRPSGEETWWHEGDVEQVDSAPMTWAAFLPDSLRSRPLYTGFYASYSTASRANKFVVDEMRLAGGGAEVLPPRDSVGPGDTVGVPPIDTVPRPPDTVGLPPLPPDSTWQPPIDTVVPPRDSVPPQDTVAPPPLPRDTVWHPDTIAPPPWPPRPPHTYDTVPFPPDWQRPPSGMALLWSEILFETESGESKFLEFYNAAAEAFSPFYLYVGVPSDNGDGDDGGSPASAPPWTTWSSSPAAPSAAPSAAPLAKIRWYRLCKDTSLRIEPHTYAVWCKSADALSPRYNSCSEQVYTASAFPTLSTSCGRLLWAWISPQDTVLGEEAVYDKAMHHALLATTKGVSLERIGFKTPATQPDNWQSASMAEGGATPGCPNSQYSGDLEEEERAHGRYFDFSTHLITPNGDGQNDYTEITWNEALQGFLCQMELYDAVGRKIKTLIKDEILPMRGSKIYHGEDDQGRSLRAGVYVWLIRLLHPDGRRKTLRYAFAVG